jgi:hypothetical protein
MGDKRVIFPQFGGDASDYQQTPHLKSEGVSIVKGKKALEGRWAGTAVTNDLPKQSSFSLGMLPIFEKFYASGKANFCSPNWIRRVCQRSGAS